MTIRLSNHYKVAIAQTKALQKDHPAGRMYGTYDPDFHLVFVVDQKHKRHGKPGWAVAITAFHGGGILSRHFTQEAAERAAQRWAVDTCTCGCAGVVEPGHEKYLPYAHQSRDPYALAL